MAVNSVNTTIHDAEEQKRQDAQQQEHIRHAADRTALDVRHVSAYSAITCLTHIN